MKPYFTDGTVTIYHGDCRDILPSLEFDCFVTDPPYGIGYAAQPTKWQRRTKSQGGSVARAKQDARGSNAAQAEHWDDAPVSGIVESIANGERKAVIWGGNYYNLPPVRGWLSWIKPDSPPSMGQFELAWTNIDQVAKSIICSISSTNPERLGHPNQKPERVIAWCLSFVSGVICDPFLGSGTTLRVAKDAGRQAIGIEREEKYCEMAARRMSQQTLFGQAT